jgi:hypothetical protein
LIAVALIALAATAQSQPVEIAECISSGNEPDCGIRHGEAFDGCGAFSWYGDRTAWYPLRYAGPILIELLVHASDATQFPSYLEIVPLEENPTGPICYEGLPGILIGIVRGRWKCTPNLGQL